MVCFLPLEYTYLRVSADSEYQNGAGLKALWAKAVFMVPDGRREEKEGRRKTKGL